MARNLKQRFCFKSLRLKSCTETKKSDYDFTPYDKEEASTFQQMSVELICSHVSGSHSFISNLLQSRHKFAISSAYVFQGFVQSPQTKQAIRPMRFPTTTNYRWNQKKASWPSQPISTKTRTSTSRFQRNSISNKWVWSQSMACFMSAALIMMQSFRGIWAYDSRTVSNLYTRVRSIHLLRMCSAVSVDMCPIIAFSRYSNFLKILNVIRRCSFCSAIKFFKVFYYSFSPCPKIKNNT